MSEKIPAHKIKYADADTDIKTPLTQHEIDQQSSEYIARVRKEAGVDILDEKLKPEDPGPAPMVAPRAPIRKPGQKPEGKQAAGLCTGDASLPARKRGWFVRIRLFI